MLKQFLWTILVPLLTFLPEALAQTGTVFFSTATYSVNDDAGTIAITVNVSGTPESNFSVDYGATGAVTTNGTLNFTTNMVTSSFSLEIPSGLTTNLLVNLALQPPTGSAILGNQSNAVLTIFATDAPPVLTGTHVFPIGIAGILTKNDGERIAFKKRALTELDYLVLVLNVDEHSISLGQLDSDNNLTYIASSSRCAFLTTGIFSANLYFQNVDIINNDINISGIGDVQIKGRYIIDTAGKTRFISGQLLGVFNDSSIGNPNEGDTLIKATLTPAGKEFNIDDITLP